MDIGLTNRTGSTGKTGSKEAPHGITGHVEQHLGNTIGGNAGDAAKHQRKDQSGHQRLQNHPGRAQNGLLIAQNKTALGKEPDQVPIPPNLLQIDIKPSFFRFQMGVVLIGLIHISSNYILFLSLSYKLNRTLYSDHCVNSFCIRICSSNHSSEAVCCSSFFK